MRIASKFGLPQPITHDEYRRGAGLPVFECDSAAKLWFNAQIVKSVGCYDCTDGQIADKFSVVVVITPVCIGDHLFKHVILLAEGTNLGSKEVFAFFPPSSVGKVVDFENYGPLKIFVGHRLEDGVVYKTEHHG